LSGPIAKWRTSPGNTSASRWCCRAAAINVVHLIYQQKSDEGHAKDYEFSGTSMREHWEAGYHDTARTLRHPQRMAQPKSSDDLVIHDLTAKTTPEADSS
jgi:hypothetical protein